MNTSIPQEPSARTSGSHDGTGAADHDQPYVFGRRPRAIAPFPFTTREYVRLVVLRGRWQDRVLLGDGVDFTTDGRRAA